MELRILGPVQAVRGGRDVPLGGPKQRAVLALLVLDAGRVVSVGQLAEALWQGRPPPGAPKTLRSYVRFAPERLALVHPGHAAVRSEVGRQGRIQHVGRGAPEPGVLAGGHVVLGRRIAAVKRRLERGALG